MKTFRKFLSEASREDAEKKRLAKDNPDEWRVRNTGNDKWTTKRKSAISGQGKRRADTLKSIKKTEFLDAAKRNLSIPNSEVRSTAKKAAELETKTKSSQSKEAKNKTKSGVAHDVDHISAQPNRRNPKNQERFKKIHPGDSSENRRVIPRSDNLSKNSKPVKSTLTRASAINKVIDRVREKK
jgi:hypothetical protein